MRRRVVIDVALAVLTALAWAGLLPETAGSLASGSYIVGSILTSAFWLFVFRATSK